MVFIPPPSPSSPQLPNHHPTDSHTGNPHIIALSSTGLSSFPRDIPLAMVPLYQAILHLPHRDKKTTEDMHSASSETWTIVLASALTSGLGGKTAVQAGREDSARGKMERKEMGYTISWEDVGKWIWESLREGSRGREEKTWAKRVASLSH
jgi:hypothetical protein